MDLGFLKAIIVFPVEVLPRTLILTIMVFGPERELVELNRGVGGGVQCRGPELLICRKSGQNPWKSGQIPRKSGQNLL